MRPVVAPLAIIGAMLLAACQPQAEPGPMRVLEEPKTETGTVTSTSSLAPSLPENVARAQNPQRGGGEPSGITCGSMTGEDAVRANVHKLPDYYYPWDTEWADASGYDPCATLSWAVVPIVGATASSARHIMLFHKGEYLGTATLEPQGFTPTVTRADDSTIDVIYHYSKPGESTAGRTGESYASFRWDAGEQRVIMTGETPPH